MFIQSCTWAVPPGWFVPFAPEERWLVLGGASETDGRGPATAAATRTLIYATAMSQARRRIARALNALRRTSGDALTSPPAGAAASGEDTPESGGRNALGPWQATVEIAQIGRWLEEFHPHSVVELDYGGLVHLLDDDSLRADQSVAEVSAAISASREGQPDLASVLYQRLRSRWQGAGVTRSRQLTIRGRLSRFHPLQRYVSLESRSVTHNSGATGATCHRIFAPGGRLVTAGDGNMVSVGHMGHPRQAPPGARQSNNRRIAKLVQEERP